MTFGSEDGAGIAKLSVIVSSIKDESSLKNCIESILPQKCDGIEIIAAVIRTRNFHADLAADYPDVDFIEYPEGTTLAALLSAGIARSKGTIIAITDSTCRVANNWLSSVLKAHETEFPVIGGSVEMSGEGSSLTDWAAYFCDYGQFMLPAQSGTVSAVPGNNFSLKRPALEIGSEFVENEFWKTLWCRKLQSSGIELFSEPKITVSREKSYTLTPFLVRRFYQGRCFAGMRSAEFTGSTSFVYAVGSVLLPMLALFRIVSPIVRKNRHFGKLLLSMPLIILATVAWSAGETIGYVAGTGNSCAVID